MAYRELARQGEEEAVQYLTRRGFRIIERNYRRPLGEIDVVAWDKDTLVFVEVKLRTSRRFGRAVEAVNQRKQHKLRRVAEWYIAERKLGAHMPMRFDVLGLDLVRGRFIIEHIPHAF